MPGTLRSFVFCDHAMEQARVMVWHADRVHVGVTEGPRAGGKLLQMIQDGLSHCGASLGDVQLWGCGTGPGGFTSVRMCVTLLQGISLGQSCPVWSVSSLALWAMLALETIPDTQAVWVAEPVHRHGQRVYTGVYTLYQGAVSWEQGQVSLCEAQQAFLHAHRPSSGLLVGAGTAWHTEHMACCQSRRALDHVLDEKWGAALPVPTLVEVMQRVWSGKLWDPPGCVRPITLQGALGAEGAVV